MSILLGVSILGHAAVPAGCRVDADCDGVRDEVDRCPSAPGPRSQDGCPPGDSTVRDADRLQQAASAIARGDCAAAVDALESVSVSAHDDPGWQLAAANAHRCVGDYEVALRVYRAYDARVPGQERIHKAIGEMLYQIAKHPPPTPTPETTATPTPFALSTPTPAPPTILDQKFAFRDLAFDTPRQGVTDLSSRPDKETSRSGLACYERSGFDRHEFNVKADKIVFCFLNDRLAKVEVIATGCHAGELFAGFCRESGGKDGPSTKSQWAGDLDYDEYRCASVGQRVTLEADSKAYYARATAVDGGLALVDKCHHDTADVTIEVNGVEPER